MKASVLKNVFVLTVCMLQRETVNLYKLKKQIGPVLGNTSSQPMAHYKWLVRLFQQEKGSACGSSCSCSACNCSA